MFIGLSSDQVLGFDVDSFFLFLILLIQVTTLKFFLGIKLLNKKLTNFLTFYYNYKGDSELILLTFSCSRSTIEILEKEVKYVQS